MDDTTWMSSYIDFNAFESLDEQVRRSEDMTAAEPHAETEAWPLDLSETEETLGLPKSPSPSSQVQSSLSPEDGNVEYTPTSSTQPDWENDVNLDLYYDSFGISRVFANSTTDGSDCISPVESRSSALSIMSRPPHSSQGPLSAQRSRDVSPALVTTTGEAHWASIAATMTMDDQQSGVGQAPSNYVFDDAAVSSTAVYNDSILSDLTIPYNAGISFRPSYEDLSCGGLSMQPHYQPLMHEQSLAHHWPLMGTTSQHTHHSTPFATAQTPAIYQQSQPQPTRHRQTLDTTQHLRHPHYPSQLATNQEMTRMRHDSRKEAPRIIPTMPSSTEIPTQGPPPPSAYAYSTQLRYAQPSMSVDTRVDLPRSAQQPIELAHIRSARSTAQAQSSKDTKAKGGRKKNTHLNAASKQRVAVMRKRGACWRCAMQRDPCDGGDPCERCQKSADKLGSFFFPCNRSKIPDFILDFLPPSMTLMHQKQPIEDYVQDQVRGWHTHRPIDVYLTCGYGHALRWRLYEFDPRSLELLGQYQYLQDPNTRRTVRYQKYSPPLGLLKLDPTDETHFRSYLDELMDQQYLSDFGWTCFEEETQVNDFQAVLLALMCDLYQRTADYDLKELLNRIIRMMIITYIMGHTLTIAEETLPAVISHVQHPYKPQYGRHTSPRLANRQLKFFFGVLRGKIYEDLLKWQQATLRTAGKKEESWLPAFCVMLGFAMVLEEQQRTVQIQADAKAHKGERSAEDSQQEALNACQRMDEKYNLMVGLFQCKYRDKKWTSGSFGPQTPTLREHAQVDFLAETRSLLEERVPHLQSREKVTFSSENQCQYTSRLVASFLLPFLKLPA